MFAVCPSKGKDTLQPAQREKSQITKFQTPKKSAKAKTGKSIPVFLVLWNFGVWDLPPAKAVRLPVWTF
jgi:hypothetical protein